METQKPVEDKHTFIPSNNKKECKNCKKIYSECMKWVDLFIIEGPKERNFYGKNIKAKHVTDLYTYELVSTMKDLDRNLEIIQIESTNTASFLLNGKGQVLSWGIDFEKEENDQNQKLLRPPTIVRSLSDVAIVSIACGDHHVIALESGMYIWTWGDNTKGQLGKFDINPSRVVTVNAIVRITAGPYSSFAVNAKGILYAWGDNTENRLGLSDDREIIEEPTEFEINPWNNEIAQKKKSYFKTESIREVEISGTSRSMIRAKQLENEDLLNRIEILSKKLDFLEDEQVSQGNKKLAKLWDKDEELKEIIKLKEKMINSNDKIKELENKINEEISELEIFQQTLEQDKEKIEADIIEDWAAIESIEKQLTDLTEKNNSLRNAVSQAIKDEVNKNQATIINNKELRKEKHAKVVYAEMQKEKIEDDIKKVKSDIISKHLENKKQTKTFDKNIDIYKQMEAIKKKQISENFMIQVHSKTYQEIGDIVTMNQAIEYASIENLTKLIGEFSYPQEIIEISNKLLEIFEKVVGGKFQRSGFSYVGKATIIWVVLMENIKLLQDLNKLRITISSKLLENTRKKPEEWNAEDGLQKKELVNKILKDADIYESIPFEDLSAKIASRKKKIILAQLAKQSLSKKSSWRSCF